jgi:hypothetical protein
MDRVIQQYHYDHRLVGELIEHSNRKREFVSDWSELDLEDLLQQMPIEEKLDLKNRAEGIYKLAEYHQVDPREYITDAELMDFVMRRGYRELREVFHKERIVWKLIRDHHLEKILFPLSAKTE